MHKKTPSKISCLGTFRRYGPQCRIWLRAMSCPESASNMVQVVSYVSPQASAMHPFACGHVSRCMRSCLHVHIAMISHGPVSTCMWSLKHVQHLIMHSGPQRTWLCILGRCAEIDYVLSARQRKIIRSHIPSIFSEERYFYFYLYKIESKINKKKKKFF
jgi:hypothetical protein